MNKNKENSSPVSMQYLGAYMDEVLNFHINPAKRSSSTTPDNVVYQPQLAIYSSDRNKLEGLQERIINGGAWNLNDTTLSLGKSNQHTEWYLITGNSVECFKFLRWIKPFLSFKLVQADIFDEFLSQKREVIRYVRGLPKAPNTYDNPYDRMEVEEELQLRLTRAKSELMPENSLPSLQGLAGIFDADVMLGLYKASDRPNSSLPIEFFARGEITSNRLGLLRALKRKYGGTGPTKSHDVSVTKVELPSYQWQINGYNLGRLLTDLEPYLVFRKNQARFILEFLKVRKILLSDRTFTNDPLIITQRTRILESFLEEWENINPEFSSAPERLVFEHFLPWIWKIMLAYQEQEEGESDEFAPKINYSSNLYYTRKVN